MSIQIEGLERTAQAFERIKRSLGAEALAKIADEAYTYAHSEVDKHTETGALIRSLKHTKQRGSHIIGHDVRQAPHAVWLHFGTGLYGPKHAKYKIKPKSKKALRWPGGSGSASGFVFAKIVNHPGVKADPWLERAGEYATNKFDSIIQEINKTWP